MIFNMSGGGGGGLNFVIVGGLTQPTSPRENTIWVNTSTTISSYVFAAEAPSNPAEGMVWIKTGTSSGVDFNALKKNVLQVYPISAKQYISGAWVSKEEKIYQSGAWRNIVVSAFYENGVQGVELVHWTDTGSVVFYDSYAKISCKANAGAHFITKDAYDIGIYKSISITYSGLTSGAEVQIKIMQWDGTKIATAKASNSSGTLTLDVSGITGKYHIAVMVYRYDASASVNLLTLTGEVA